MGGKLNDLKRKKIIADYIETQNYSETGRMNNVSDKTVKRVVERESDLVGIVEQKKEENTRDILEYMDQIYDKQKSIIDLSLNALEKKLKNPDMFTNVKDIVTVYGVILDKALKYKEIKTKNGSGNNEELSKVEQLLAKIKDEANDNK